MNLFLWTNHEYPLRDSGQGKSWHQICVLTSRHDNQDKTQLRIYPISQKESPCQLSPDQSVIENSHRFGNEFELLHALLLILHVVRLQDLLHSSSHLAI